MRGHEGGANEYENYYAKRQREYREYVRYGRELLLYRTNDIKRLIHEYYEALRRGDKLCRMKQPV